jgi:hypothetical protein
MQTMISGFVRILIVVVLLVQIAACGKGICLQGAGEVTTETRTAAPFTEIALYNRVNVVLIQDTVNSIQVEAGRHLLSGIETSIENNVLTIADNNTCNWARDLDTRIKVFIHAANLQKINYYGSGDVTSANTLQAEKLAIDSWEGVGSFKLDLAVQHCDVILRKNNTDVTLSGNCDFAYVYCGDQGKADLRNLVCNQVSVDHKGIYDTYVNAKDSLAANVLYKGNVYYKGHPPVMQAVCTNTGKMISIQ